MSAPSNVTPAADLGVCPVCADTGKAPANITCTCACPAAVAMRAWHRSAAALGDDVSVVRSPDRADLAGCDEDPIDYDACDGDGAAGLVGSPWL